MTAGPDQLAIPLPAGKASLVFSTHPRLEAVDLQALSLAPFEALIVSVPYPL
jgi:hypothetical protein